MDEKGPAAGHSTAFHVEEGGRVGDITVRGDVAGRDIIKITAELTYDVSDLGHNPYLGLANYTYATRAFFGGREPQIRDAVARLTAPGEEPVVLFVTGASGSGKSSLAQAGLVPALEAAYATHGRHVCWSVMRPGRHPLAAFARALEELGFAEPPAGGWSALLRTPQDLNLLLATQTPPKQINVLILDQFEELFTQAEPAERDAMCSLLSGLDTFGRIHLHAVATLRADYLPALFGVPALFERAKQAGIELRAMSSEELARAIRRPIQEQARLEGKDKRLDPALVERLVEDVAGDPALLPLLQVTLRALWDEPPHRMVLDRYQSLTSTLEQQANRLIDEDGQGHARAAAEREQLLAILLDLVEVSLDDDPRRDVRRALPKQDVLLGHPERTRLVEELVNARLITLSVEQRGQPSVEMIDIIHETLLGNWPRLRAAIAAQREALQQRERFRLALREWLQSDRREQYLLDGVRLAEARSLAQRNDVALRDADGRTFLEQSRHAEAEARTRELRQARRRQGILALVAGVAMVFAIAAIVAAGFAFSSQQAAVVAQAEALTAQQHAERQAQVALSRQLAAQAINEQEQFNQDERSALLARQAYLISQRAQGTALGQIDEALRVALSPAHFSRILGGDRPWVLHEGSVRTIALSPTAPILAAGGNGVEGVRLWDLSQRDVPPTVLGGQAVGAASLAFSRDGTLLAGADDERGLVRVWDMSSRREVLTLPVRPNAGTAMAFGNDANTLVTSSAYGPLVLWDLRLPGGAPVQLGGDVPGPSLSVAFSADGSHVARSSEDGVVRLFDPRQPGKAPVELGGHHGLVHSVTISADGRMLASGGRDRTIQLWDLARLEAGPVVLRGHDDNVWTLAFSPDGQLLASGSPDRTVRLWDPHRPTEPPLVLAGHKESLNLLSWSHDGRILASGSFDKIIRIWEINSVGAGPTVLSGHSGGVRSVAFRPLDGGLLASGSSDGSVRLWNPAHPVASPLVLDTLDTEINAVAFSPDGATLVAGGGSQTFITRDNPLWIWDMRALATGAPIGSSRIPGPTGAVESVAFSHAGARLAATSYGEGALRLWDLGQPGTPPREFTDAVSFLHSVAFSHDDQLLASAGYGSIFVRNLGAPNAPPLQRQGSGANAVAFSSITNDLASGAGDGSVSVWHLNEPNRAPLELRGHDGPVNAVAFSPDGGTLASASSDNTIRLWNLRQPETAPRVLRGHRGQVWSVAFSPDGQTLASGSADGTVRLWIARTESLVDLVCEKVWRNLTLAEWRQFVGADVAYEPTCPNLPPGYGVV